MKTIFITIFEGVESKNILRTDVLRTILSEPELKIVLFTKSDDRVKHHQEEFNDPRIAYEVVQRIPIKGLDKFFMHLKFLLLRTSTTRLQRKVRLEKTNNYSNYLVREFFNWLLARPFFVKLSQLIDYYFVKNSTYASYFEKEKPDLVFLANLFDETEIHLLREAKKRGVKTIGLINSWDRATARCILRLLPDKLIAFNELVKQDLIKYHAVKERDIYVSGLPHYDFHFRAPYCSKKEFFAKIGVPENHKLIVYGPIGLSETAVDWDIIDLLYDINRKGKLGENISVFVRFPPNAFFEEEEIKKRPWLLGEYPGLRFSKKRGIDWDMTIEELQQLSDTLYHMSLLVCYSSSISVDASFFGRPVININFETRKSKEMIGSVTCYYKKDHYWKTLRTGGIRLVNSPNELAEWIKKYLDNPSLDKEGRERLAQEQCYLLDGKSGERIGKFVLGFINQ